MKAWGVQRRDFDSTLIPDRVIAIETGDSQPCRCLTVEDDHSFLANDIAVHNSLLVSVFWPAWEWVNQPGIRGQFGSYDEGLAIRDSVRTRDLITSEWY